jgi:NitT/TauT family transport system substrate-binding protein
MNYCLWLALDGFDEGRRKKIKDVKRRGARRSSAQGVQLQFEILHLFVVLLVFAASSGLAVETITAQTQPLQKVRIAYASSGINYADIFLAKEKGFYREEGLEPQFIQMSSGIAITAGISGELDGQASVGSTIRAIQRGAPLRVVAVTLRRPLYWLVVRPEYRSVKDLKGKVLGISTIGGSQHNRAKAMLAMGGVDSDRDITSISDQRSDDAAASASQQRSSSDRAQSSMGRCGAGQIQDEHP